jgi:hypothetical protein
MDGGLGVDVVVMNAAERPDADECEQQNGDVECYTYVKH